MSGNCIHRIGKTEDKKGIYLVNSEDGYYDQIFETAEEIDAFIKNLKELRNEVFKEEK